MFAESAADHFSADVLLLARRRPGLVDMVEKTLDHFLTSGARRMSFEPMPRPERALVHEASRKYGVVTGSYGDDPQRRVDIFKSERQGWPPYRLSDAARAASAATAGGTSSGGPAAGGGVGPQQRLDAALSCTLGPTSWLLHFDQVENADSVRTLLRPFGEEAALQWTTFEGGDKRKPTAGVATFNDKAAYDTARTRAGGGLRGAYRVVVAPASASKALVPTGGTAAKVFLRAGATAPAAGTPPPPRDHAARGSGTSAAEHGDEAPDTAGDVADDTTGYETTRRGPDDTGAAAKVTTPPPPGLLYT